MKSNQSLFFHTSLQSRSSQNISETLSVYLDLQITRRSAGLFDPVHLFKLRPYKTTILKKCTYSSKSLLPHSANTSTRVSRSLILFSMSLLFSLSLLLFSSLILFSYSLLYVSSLILFSLSLLLLFSLCHFSYSFVILLLFAFEQYVIREFLISPDVDQEGTPHELMT